MKRLFVILIGVLGLCAAGSLYAENEGDEKDVAASPASSSTDCTLEEESTGTTAGGRPLHKSDAWRLEGAAHWVSKWACGDMGTTALEEVLGEIKPDAIKDKDWLKVLHNVIGADRIDAVVLLLKQEAMKTALVNHADSASKILRSAMYNLKPQIVLALVEAGLRLNELDAQSMPLLHWSIGHRAKEGFMALIKKLIELRLYINDRDMNGRTPLDRVSAIEDMRDANRHLWRHLPPEPVDESLESIRAALVAAGAQRSQGHLRAQAASSSTDGQAMVNLTGEEGVVGNIAPDALGALVEARSASL